MVAIPPVGSATVLLAAASPTVSLSLLPAVTILGAVIAVIDAISRIRRHGTGSIFTIVELPLALLLFVRSFPPVQPYVSTSIATAYLAIPLEVLLILLLFLKGSRKGAWIWLTVAAVVVNGAAVVLAVLHLG